MASQRHAKMITNLDPSWTPFGLDLGPDLGAQIRPFGIIFRSCFDLVCAIGSQMVFASAGVRLKGPAEA